MQGIKLAVIGVFIFGSLGVTFWRSPDVAGQAGGPSISAPTNVIASDNLYNNKVGVYWDVIRDATAYRIFRNTVDDSSTAIDIGTTAAPFFFDNAANPGQSFFYWVRAENGANVSSFSSSDVGSRSLVNFQPGPGAQPPLNPPPPAPPANNLTGAKVYLGKALFWDEQMSSTKTVSCGTCHHSSTGGTDPRATAVNPGPDGLINSPDDIHGSAGVPSNNADGSYVSIPTYGVNDQVTGRKTVSYVNAAYSPLLFWDGRATAVFSDPLSGATLLNGGGALESQSVGPPVSTAEMGNNGRTWNDVASRIAASKPLALSPSIPTPLKAWINNRSYPELFAEAFGSTDVTPARIAFAIASFERTLFSDQTPADLDGAGITPLSAAAVRGRNIFNSAGPGGANCSGCHVGPLFSDNQFHDIGVRPAAEDTGRGAITGNPANNGQFRTPSLRNAGLRTSFFHNGRFTTLNQVVAFYNRGGDFGGPSNPNKDPRVHPLGLGPNQQADLVAYLQSLTDPRVANEEGPFSRPTLYMESARVPFVSGTGRAGTGGVVPQIKTISPPILGNTNFTITLDGALPNANATLIVETFDTAIGDSIPPGGTMARIATTTQPSSNGGGWATATFTIPPNGVPGRNYFARWYVEDPGAANGVSVSQVAVFTLFGDAPVAPTAASVNVAGRVVTASGAGIRNVAVTLTDADGVARTALTGAFGYYQFSGVLGGRTYVMSAAAKRFSFAEASRVLNVSDNITRVDFVASGAPGRGGR